MSEKINKANGSEEAVVEEIVAKPKGPTTAELRAEIKSLKGELKELAVAISKVAPKNGHIQRIVRPYL